jgi:hypothetical protein
VHTRSRSWKQHPTLVEAAAGMAPGAFLQPHQTHRKSLTTVLVCAVLDAQDTKCREIKHDAGILDKVAIDGTTTPACYKTGCGISPTFLATAGSHDAQTATSNTNPGVVKPCGSPGSCGGSSDVREARCTFHHLAKWSCSMFTALSHLPPALFPCCRPHHCNTKSDTALAICPGCA